MLRPLLSLVTIAAALAVGGCPGSGGGVGSSCGGRSDCADDLQCVNNVCVPLCQRAPDCGDGFACTADGLCVEGDGESGDRCASEVECQAGLSCVLDESAGEAGELGASCAPDRDGEAFGARCDADDDCRNGTCAVGRCVDVCLADLDCAVDHVCTSLHRIDAELAFAQQYLGVFKGCLPAAATINWPIPVEAPAATVYLPVPGNATSMTVVMEVEDESQLVGAHSLTAPDGALLYRRPSSVADFFNSLAVRHAPAPGISTLMLPSSDRADLVTDERPYALRVSSFRPPDLPGSAVPRVTAIAKLGDGTKLDLHFNFLDLSEHPCAAEMGGPLNAEVAALPGSPFQAVFVAELRLIFARAGIALGVSTYDDVVGRPDLDGLDSRDLPALLSLSTRPGGVNVFFVRTMTPVGLQALVGANPGDPRPGSPAGGVAISVDTLCYRGWSDVARTAAHAIARHMGLFRNVEPPRAEGTFQDPIGDSNTSTENLMHYSEFGGTELSTGQREIIRKSPVLQ